jgi:hypothetical protein
MKRIALFLSACAGCAQVLAHEGHGMPGVSHWHATDLLGFALVLLVVIAIIWFKGRDR